MTNPIRAWLLTTTAIRWKATIPQPGKPYWTIMGKQYNNLPTWEEL